ncbi:hypothetical protein [Vulcanisaeta distributa]|uniref:hypothetical protein n=1 Tax=Vulcanisaeta distributa TaxID=164451 RepID=UPI001FB2A755|nr:hypothetical protein [Vulcanisaeta distributa]
MVRNLGRQAVTNPGMIPYRQGGTVRLIDTGNGMGGFFPSIYWTRVVMPNWEDISWEKVLKQGTSLSMAPAYTAQWLAIKSLDQAMVSMTLSMRQQWPLEV